MKQTAVSWLLNEFQEAHKDFGGLDLEWLKRFNQAEEMEKQQSDDYAIEFANWVNSVSYRSFDGNWYLTQENEDIKKTTKELLEIFKKEKGL